MNDGVEHGSRKKKPGTELHITYIQKVNAVSIPNYETQKNRTAIYESCTSLTYSDSESSHE